MKAKVKIKELAQDMQMQIEGWQSFLNTETGEVVSIADGQLGEAEELEMTLDEDLDGDPLTLAIQQLMEEADDELSSALDVHFYFEKYERLPDEGEIDEYSMMESFCSEVSNERDQELLFRAIQGRGAFRRFKDQAADLGLLNEWYAFKDGQYAKAAIRWCEGLELEYEV